MLSVQTSTGSELDVNGEIRGLSRSALEERRAPLENPPGIYAPLNPIAGESRQYQQRETHAMNERFLAGRRRPHYVDAGFSIRLVVTMRPEGLVHGQGIGVAVARRARGRGGRSPRGPRGSRIDAIGSGPGLRGGSPSRPLRSLGVVVNLLAGQEEVEGRGEGVLVGGGLDLAEVEDLLGGHVVGRPPVSPIMVRPLMGELW